MELPTYIDISKLQSHYTYMKRILHLVSVKNNTFESSYNWFKVDILRLVRPLTAIFGPAQGHLNYYIYVVANVQIQLMYTLAGRVANVYIS